MNSVSLEFLTRQLELAEQLLAGRETMFEPQDLPGRFGRVVQALDRVLDAVDSEAVVGGGWAVWRHGYFARMTQDIDIVLPAEHIDEFLRVAAVSGFEVPRQQAGRWPKLLHKSSDITVDVLPEGERPGTASNPAPTTIAHPRQLGGSGSILRYISLPGLIELKIAAGRVRDEGDIVELLRVNPAQIDAIRNHLGGVDAGYVAEFDRLLERAQEQTDE